MNNNSLFNKLSVVLVSIYLFAVGCWLLLTRQIPRPALRKIVRAYFRKPYAGELSGFEREAGHCWVALVPGELLSDCENLSALAVFEDGKPLPHPHAMHDDIRRLGGGRFSHWGEKVYFSTPDNSDPNSNGRHYTAREIK